MKDIQEALSRQRAMNKQTWQALLENGLTLDDEVELDFFYYCQERNAADSLKKFLEQETDYQVTVAPSPDDREEEWSVSGRTGKTNISPEILDEWVEWMIIAGQEFKCEFDGWGTEVG